MCSWWRLLQIRSLGCGLIGIVDIHLSPVDRHLVAAAVVTLCTPVLCCAGVPVLPGGAPQMGVCVPAASHLRGWAGMCFCRGHVCLLHLHQVHHLRARPANGWEALRGPWVGGPLQFGLHVSLCMMLLLFPHLKSVYVLYVNCFRSQLKSLIRQIVS